MQYLLLFGCLLLTVSPAAAQDERTFQAYQKQAQRYESQKNYRQAIDTYRKALLYADPEKRKQVDQEIAHLDELLQMQQLVNQGLANTILKKINALTNGSNRGRLKSDLIKLQNQEDASKSDYQTLLSQVEAAKRSETEADETAVASTPAPPPPPRRPATTSHPSRPSGPPPKTVTVSTPGKASGGTPKSSRDAKAAKSAGELRTP